ncbi:aldo/keto reductase [Paenibacillus cremeus]|nr:aldo/keto reductase [Paenibacillus cremeus]
MGTTYTSKKSQNIVKCNHAYYYEIAERFTAHAAEHGVNAASLAMAWVMSHPAVTAPIIGARTMEQLELAIAAQDIHLTPEWRDAISALSITPPPATDRSEEQEKPRIS